jgi:hypothetical protein
MRRWLKNRIGALLDNVLGVAVFSLAAMLLPLGPVYRLAAICTICWRSTWPWRLAPR